MGLDVKEHCPRPAACVNKEHCPRPAVHVDSCCDLGETSSFPLVELWGSLYW